MKIALFFLLISSCSGSALKASYCFKESNPIPATTPYLDNIKNISLQLQNEIMSTGIFASTTAGLEPNIYAFALCRTGFEGLPCSKCVSNAIKVLLDSSCKTGIAYHFFCHVVISNKIIPVLPMVALPACLVIEPPNTIMKNMPTFLNSILFTLANETSYFAAKNERRFASSILSIPGAPTFYSYMQCTPDLSVNECIACFDIFPAYLLTYLIGHSEGAIVRERCTMIFSIHKFYKSVPSLALGQKNLTTEIPAINLTSLGSPVTMTPPQVVVNTNGGGEKDKTKGAGSRILQIMLPVFVVACVIAVAFVALWCKRSTSEKKEPSTEYLEGMEDFKSLLLDPSIIRMSTGNFSKENQLGEGGFGVVYKGLLPDGTEIAVKRLTKGSTQGIREVKNELVSAANLQHRNLVNLMGASIDKHDISLVYEFVPNNTLAAFIFDEEKRTHLSWSICYKVICGIARGLVYLHIDCRLKIIHRDLKPSNILLEADFNPKISDFGLASVTEGHSNIKASHIAGTYGYMAPEYLKRGEMSHKSDVYSFGVIVLEILTGRRNKGGLFLIKSVWKSWIDGTVMDVLHPSIHTVSSEDEVLNCVRIALLCTQDNPRNRPSMSTVTIWLQGKFTATMPAPLEPGVDVTNATQEGSSSNKMTITELDPR